MPSEELTRRTAMQIVAGGLVSATGCNTFSKSITEALPKVDQLVSARDQGQDSGNTEAESRPAVEIGPPKAIGESGVAGRLYFVYFATADEAALGQIQTVVSKFHGAWNRYGENQSPGAGSSSRMLVWVHPNAIPDLRKVAIRVAPLVARQTLADLIARQKFPFVIERQEAKLFFDSWTELIVVLAPNSWRSVPAHVEYHSTEIVAEQLAEMLHEFPVKVAALPSSGWLEGGADDRPRPENPPGIVTVNFDSETRPIVATIVQSHPQVLGLSLKYRIGDFQLCGFQLHESLGDLRIKQQPQDIER